MSKYPQKGSSISSFPKIGETASKMALSQAIAVLLFVLVLARIDPSTCRVIIKGKVSCLDCKSKADLSGIKILVKCDKVKKLALATTEDDGSFKVKAPSDHTPRPTPLSCLSKLLGGPNQLYSSKKFTTSEIVKTNDSNTYTISNLLSFYTSCPSTIGRAKCETMKKLASSKTVDLPLPREWGLAPSSYYINPFIPIIGIP